MQKTWGTIISEARSELFPFPGEAKPHIPSHTKYFHLAAMDLQHWIPELQVRNTSQFPFCSTYFNCGQTVVDQPIGLIQRVYTIANNEWCDKAFYCEAGFCEVECWSHNLLSYELPDNTGLSPLPMGFRQAEASSDSTCGRARVGIFAKHRGRIHVAPWIQSNETLLIEWDGVKKEWLETDVLDTELWDDRVINAIKTFVKWYHEIYFGCDPTAKLNLERDYAGQRADLIHYFAEITQKKACCVCDNQRGPTQAELDDDTAPAEPSPFIMSAVGDHGEDDSERDAVADLVDSWGVGAHLFLGDNWYDSDITLADLVARTGTVFERYNTDDILLPLLGNHDRDPVGHLAVELAHFNFRPIQTASGEVASTGYYSYSPDPRIEIFIVDSGYDNSQVNQQADGVLVTSAQAAWLRVALARSVAKWKIVALHHPPYTSFRSVATGPTLSSDGFLAYPQLRWPFKDWGADIVLNGHIHSYERLEIDDFPHMVVGTGSRSLADNFDLNNLSPYSVARDDDHFGALRITCVCASLKCEFIRTDGVISDTLLLEK